MSTLITATSDPSTHARLTALWNGSDGWVIDGGTHYMVVEMPPATNFVEKETVPELLDTRSFGAKAAQYTKLDQ